MSLDSEIILKIRNKIWISKSCMINCNRGSTFDMTTEFNDKLHKSPIHLLHRAGQCAYEIFQSEVKEGDLTPRQLAVLMTVANHEGLSQTGLVDRTGIDRSTLADIVRRMQRKGLLQRRRTREDARAYAVRLTDEGRKVLENAEPLAKRVDERILEALPPKQREQFLQELTAIVRTLQKMSEPAAAETPRSQNEAA